MYEELFYSSYTTSELINIINDPSQLGAYRKRCEQELNKRKEQQNEITKL